MTKTARYYVKVDRDDGSRTYKGPWVMAHCEREASAWRQSFPSYGVEVVPVDDARDDVRRWAAATRVDGFRYCPRTGE